MSNWMFDMPYDYSGEETGKHRRIYGKKGGGGGQSAPDYSQMAAASLEAAKLGKELGDATLAESTRQYDRNMEVAQPIIDAQTKMMQSAQQQGDEYYSYWKTKAQPVEDALNTDAMASGGAAAQEEAAGKAAADVRRGTTQQANMIARQGLRYGYSPAKMAAMAGSQAGTNASMIASSMTGARDKEKQLGFAKKMDVAGIYRGMPGASTGAYSAATAAGNGAVGNSIGVGNGMTNGAIAAGGLTMQGQGLRIQGLNGILNSQTSMYDSMAASNASSRSGTMGLVGAGIGAAATIF